MTLTTPVATSLEEGRSVNTLPIGFENHVRCRVAPRTESS
jgi:hypothetical protein